jgi:hypothetical protein
MARGRVMRRGCFETGMQAGVWMYSYEPTGSGASRQVLGTERTPTLQASPHRPQADPAHQRVHLCLHMDTGNKKATRAPVHGYSTTNSTNNFAIQNWPSQTLTMHLLESLR